MASLAMFDYLVNDNDLKPVMEQHGLVLPEDLDFIKEQIAGPLDTNAAEDQKQPGSSSVWDQPIFDFYIKLLVTLSMKYLLLLHLGSYTLLHYTVYSLTCM